MKLGCPDGRIRADAFQPHNGSRPRSATREPDSGVLGRRPASPGNLTISGRGVML